MRGIYDFLQLVCELASRLVNLFDHPAQVHTQVLVCNLAVTCINLRVHLTTALQLYP